MALWPRQSFTANRFRDITVYYTRLATPANLTIGFYYGNYSHRHAPYGLNSIFSSVAIMKKI